MKMLEILRNKKPLNDFSLLSYPRTDRQTEIGALSEMYNLNKSPVPLDYSP
jgi:hypothetical protein